CLGWERIYFQLQARGRPRILPGNLAIAHGPGQVQHRQQIAQRKNRGARRGQHVKHLEFRRIGVIAARHAEIAKNELREEGQVETDEENHRGCPRERYRVETAGNLRPPEMQAADITHSGGLHCWWPKITGRLYPESLSRAEPAGNLRPPEMQAADITHNGAAHHDVVE